MEILASELRIGNLLLDEKKATFHEVTNIYKTGGSVDYHYPLHWYAPIPLTPEILEKCGIKGLHTKKLHSIFKLSPIKEGGYSVHVGTIYTTITIQECKIQDIQYLHQLQNLYFALTGEELNYTP